LAKLQQGAKRGTQLREEGSINDDSDAASLFRILVIIEGYLYWIKSEKME